MCPLTVSIDSGKYLLTIDPSLPQSTVLAAAVTTLAKDMLAHRECDERGQNYCSDTATHRVTDRRQERQHSARVHKNAVQYDE